MWSDIKEVSAGSPFVGVEDLFEVVGQDALKNPLVEILEFGRRFLGPEHGLDGAGDVFPFLPPQHEVQAAEEEEVRRGETPTQLAIQEHIRFPLQEAADGHGHYAGFSRLSIRQPPLSRSCFGIGLGGWAPL
jgi:hypothetical protein